MLCRMRSRAIRVPDLPTPALWTQLERKIDTIDRVKFDFSKAIANSTDHDLILTKNITIKILFFDITWI